MSLLVSILPIYMCFVKLQCVGVLSETINVHSDGFVAGAE